MTVRIQKPKDKERVLRREDAFIFLHDALAAPPRSKLRQTYLEGALMAYYFGLMNEQRFGQRGDRRGAPPGKRGSRIDDSDALAIMREIANALGETNAHRLARLAVQTGKVPLSGAQEANVVRRLAERWRAEINS